MPSELKTPAAFKSFGDDFLNYLYRENTLKVHYHPVAKLYGEPGESEREFKIRVQQAVREQRDGEVEKLRRKYATEFQKLETKLYREQQELARDQATYEGRKREELLSAGESIISVLGVFGRRGSTTALSKAARKRRLTAKSKTDVDESVREIARLQDEIQKIRGSMEQQVNDIHSMWDAKLEAIETHTVRPKKSDCAVETVSLAWTPYWEIGYRTAAGAATSARIPAWRKPIRGQA